MSIDAAIEKATKLGAQVALPKIPVPQVGAVAAIVDPQGTIAGCGNRRGRYLLSNYSRGAICSTASFDVITGYTSKSIRSRHVAIHSSSKRRSWVSISW